MCQIEGCLFLLYNTDAAEFLKVLSANRSMIIIGRCIFIQSKMHFPENFLAIADITQLVARANSGPLIRL